ncbi:nose resistant to fluoxetine protein 6-like [Uranotaenia lowii]|uniref:nose resistant to fluoxetine protein 6-like n=1 Tax=Uranotaenia lowii TaxID=190385 RepID=UPI002479DC70|nr:nose resistant to fluoxetine protein 6-like [Uranotaenia lowii]XP_055608119.1 nose resistant to fluoxetine protein 6-like [Uranotaenia lowii]
MDSKRLISWVLIFEAYFRIATGAMQLPGFDSSWWSLWKNGSTENVTECELQIEATISNLWGLQMLDAWGKWPSGILSGNMYDLGHYDQCRKFEYVTHQEDANRSAESIRGRYCLMDVPLTILSDFFNNNTVQRGFPTLGGTPSIKVGTCFPDSCSSQQLRKLINSTLKFEVAMECESPLPPIQTKDIVAIFIFSAIGFLLILSTVYDVCQRIRSRQPRMALAMFSLYSNGLKLFQVVLKERSHLDYYKKSEQIDCLNGIRVLSMVWIVFCHNYLMVIVAPNVNPISVFDWVRSYHSMIVVAATVSVDSFFLMSGMLVCWSLLKELNRSSRLNLPLMYLHRYLRLTPPFAALILLTATVLKYFGSGPFWNSTLLGMEQACDKYWWSALLYLQNYVNPTQMCLGHSWYLSVDMQLYILSPLIIYPLWRWRRKALVAIAALILLSMGCVIALFLVYELRLSMLDPKQSPERNKMTLTYYPTHTRMGAWLVGAMFGYLLHETKLHRVILRKQFVTAGWIAAIVTILTVIFVDFPFQQPENFQETSLFLNALYEACSRVFWAIALGWVVFACVNGYGGPIDTFLSLSIWQPLGRLSYCIYLLHMSVQTMQQASVRNGSYFGDIRAVHNFWGDFGYTVTLAVVWSLAFESPVMILEKLLFGKALANNKKSDSNLLNEGQTPASTSIADSTETLPSKDQLQKV